jgi:hypothetical protein
MIISVGALSRSDVDAGDASYNPNIKVDALLAGLAVLEREIEPTLIVFPDATLLNPTDAGTLHRSVLQHCRSLRSRFAIFDVRGGNAPDASMWTNDLQVFRNGIGDTGLNFGAAYHPFVHAAILRAEEVTAEVVGGSRTLRAVLSDATLPRVKSLLTALDRTPLADRIVRSRIDAELRAASPDYAELHACVVRLLNTLPPSGAVAGAMVTTDALRGVWTAPANVRLQGVEGLTQTLNDRSQVLLNDEYGSGKSINALREFPGRGILIWGARTLDGASSEWQYISVRRTAIMIGQSIKRALTPFALEPNDAKTWNKLRHLIENFLFGLWKQGALKGTKPEHAYVVHVGLGSTMTDDDVTNGLLKISVMIALLRPAEFLILAFQQKQSSAG